MEFALGAGRGLVAEHLVFKGNHGSYAVLMWLLGLGHRMDFRGCFFVAVILDSTLQKKGIKNLEHDSMDLLQTQIRFLSM
jgi:hypothetical protein